MNTTVHNMTKIYIFIRLSGPRQQKQPRLLASCVVLPPPSPSRSLPMLVSTKNCLCARGAAERLSPLFSASSAPLFHSYEEHQDVPSSSAYPSVDRTPLGQMCIRLLLLSQRPTPRCHQYLHLERSGGGLGLPYAPEEVLPVGGG